MAGAGNDPVGDEPEKARKTQIADHDHHAEQQGDRVEVDRPQRPVERQRAEAHHQARAEERRPGPVQVKSRQFPEGDDDIGRGKDQDRRNPNAVGPKLGKGCRLPGRGEKCRGKKDRCDQSRGDRDSGAPPPPPALMPAARAPRVAEARRRHLESSAAGGPKTPAGIGSPAAGAAPGRAVSGSASASAAKAVAATAAEVKNAAE